MEELLADTSKFIRIEFNKKHKVNQEIRHLLDLEAPIKDCLDDLLKTNNKTGIYLLKVNNSKVNNVFIVNFEHISDLVLVLLLLTLSM